MCSQVPCSSLAGEAGGRSPELLPTGERGPRRAEYVARGGSAWLAGPVLKVLRTLGAPRWTAVHDPYPLTGLLGSDISISPGLLSSPKGLRDDNRMM